MSLCRIPLLCPCFQTQFLGLLSLRSILFLLHRHHILPLSMNDSSGSFISAPLHPLGCFFPLACLALWPARPCQRLFSDVLWSVVTPRATQKLGAAWGCICHSPGRESPFPSQAPLLPWAALSSPPARALVLFLSRDVIQEGQPEPQPAVFSGQTRRQLCGERRGLPQRVVIA